MKILVFDTCLDKMYVTLAQDDKIVDSRVVTNQNNKYHSAYLISTIKSILRDNDLTPKDLGAIGTNVGPGSFTGIRACTTVARMMAQQLKIPVYGISSLEILSKIANDDSSVMVVTDARKNSGYLYYDGEIRGAVLLDEIKQLLSAREFNLITDDRLVAELGGTSYQQGEYPLGNILAGLVYEKTKTANGDLHELKPLYIQPPPTGY